MIAHPTVGDPPAREELHRANVIKSKRENHREFVFPRTVIDHYRQSFRVGLRRPAEHEKRTRKGGIVILLCDPRDAHATERQGESRDARNNFEYNESRVVFREHAGRGD